MLPQFTADSSWSGVEASSRMWMLMIARFVTLHETSWPDTGEPSALVQWMSTSIVYGDAGDQIAEPPTLSGIVCEPPTAESVIVPACGGSNAPWPSPPPPPQLLNAALASSK